MKFINKLSDDLYHSMDNKPRRERRIDWFTGFLILFWVAFMLWLMIGARYP